MDYKHQMDTLRAKLLEKPRAEWPKWLDSTLEVIQQLNPGEDLNNIRERLLKLAADVSNEKAQTEFTALSTGDLLATLGLTIKRDEENKLITFLCELSAYTESAQLNISFNAPSSTGKSYIPTEIARLFPKEDVIEIAYCSPTAFFHDVGVFDKTKGGYIVNLERKIMLFLDQPHTLLLQHLRPLLSHDEKEIQIKITDKSQKGGLKTKNVYIRGFPAVIFCTANVNIDEQESTRFILLSPETHPDKIQEAVRQRIKKETQPELYRKSLQDDPGRQALQERILAIKYANVREIRILNSKRIEELFFARVKHLKPRHSRDMGRLLSLIQAFALLNWTERDKCDGAIIATDADIDAAFKAWDGIAESQELNLPPFVYRVYKEVIEPAWMEKLLEDNQGHDFTGSPGLSRQDIAKKHLNVYGRNLPDWQMRQQFLPMLETAGLITQEKDPADSRKILIYPPNPIPPVQQNNSESAGGVTNEPTESVWMTDTLTDESQTI